MTKSITIEISNQSCSKEFCDTEDGFIPAYQDGTFILCEPCYQEELSDDQALRPWAYYG